jgi:hypothetical protein
VLGRTGRVGRCGGGVRRVSDASPEKHARIEGHVARSCVARRERVVRQ